MSEIKVDKRSEILGKNAWYQVLPIEVLHDEGLINHYDYNLIKRSGYHLNRQITIAFPYIMQAFDLIIKPLQLNCTYQAKLNKPINVSMHFEANPAGTLRCDGDSELNVGYSLKYEFTVTVCGHHPFQIDPCPITFSLKEFARLTGKDRRDYVAREIVKQLDVPLGLRLLLPNHIRKVYPDFEDRK